jgi:hypothetical protein
MSKRKRGNGSARRLETYYTVAEVAHYFNVSSF